MFDVGPMELLIILIIVCIYGVISYEQFVLGPKRLPDAGRSLGRGVREFKHSLAGNDEDELRAAEAAEEKPEPVHTSTPTEQKP